MSDRPDVDALAQALEKQPWYWEDAWRDASALDDAAATLDALPEGWFIANSHMYMRKRAREQYQVIGAQQERERLSRRVRRAALGFTSMAPQDWVALNDALADPEEPDPVAVAEAPYATGGANVPPVNPDPNFYRDTFPDPEEPDHE